jgi:hypothetical protein
MTYKELDFYFPFVVFCYGLTMTLVLNSAFLMKIAHKKFTPELVTQMNMHRSLAVVCLVVGSLWSLQNLWSN